MAYPCRLFCHPWRVGQVLFDEDLAHHEGLQATLVQVLGLSRVVESWVQQEGVEVASCIQSMLVVWQIHIEPKCMYQSNDDGSQLNVVLADMEITLKYVGFLTCV